jgi:hypothetical protein
MLDEVLANEMGSTSLRFEVHRWRSKDSAFRSDSKKLNLE